ncbi:MAG: sulfatase-like hydrolase/transferase [Singulisphaera sp.]
MANYGNAGGPIQKTSSNAVPNLEKYHGTDTFLTEALTIEAKARVSEAVEAKKPFYLYFAQYAVHAPFNSDPRFAGHYASPDKSPQAQAFATLIEGMDRSLGGLLDHLESLGVAEDTPIFFAGITAPTPPGP